MIEADPGLCPVHGLPDCSPLLNGCSRLTAQISVSEPRYEHEQISSPEVYAQVPTPDLGVPSEQSLTVPGEPLEVPDYTYRGAAVLLTQSTLHSLLEVPEGHRIRRVYADAISDSVVVLVEGPDLPRVAEGCEPCRVYAESEAVPVVMSASGEPGYKLAWKIKWESVPR